MMFVSASEDNATIIESRDSENIISDNDLKEIYISPSGNDDGGNGSLDNPFSSIGHAIQTADNNSKIMLMDGVYADESNMNIVVDKNIILESVSGNVTINGQNKNSFFKIKEGSSLVLNNIKFINGYTNSFSQLGVINNQGNLIVNNSLFNSMNSVMSTFFNEGNLIIENTVISNSNSENMAKIVTNIGNVTISNSKLTSEEDVNSKNLPAVYNYNNINIINSQISSILTNPDYDQSGYEPGFILIQNSTIYVTELYNSNAHIFNSKFTGRFYVSDMNINAENSVFNPTASLINVVSIFDSNFTAVHSIFSAPVASGHVNLNITYSAILGSVSGTGKGSSIYAPYNWWGVNTGPSVSYFSNSNISNWAILTFEVEDGNNSVGTHSKFIASINKWFDGNNTYEFESNQYLPDRQVRFEAQNGKFLYSTATLKNTLENYLINNILDCNVFCIADNQRLSLTIGEGLSNYSYFVAPWGSDKPDGGTLENPFKTIQYAVNMANNGNTICLLEGVHDNIANSKVTISKNLTIVGLGDVTLVRDNGANIFNIQEWGNLVVKNINFAVNVREYNDNLFVVRGGNLTVIGCNFTKITTNAIIYTSVGVENVARVFIYDSQFSDIAGSVIYGSAMTYIKNSNFTDFSNFYKIKGLENYNAIFALTNSIEIYDSVFDSNNMGIITLHPYSYSSNSLLGASPYSQYYEKYGRYAYIENSLFINNVFGGLNNQLASIGMGLDIHDSYSTFNGFINNSKFINNKGKIAIVNEVFNSSFINNHGQDFGGRALIQADSIVNSEFISNMNRYIDYNNAYLGEGIVSANSILNSTFINNKASFGGAVANTKEIHYCVFVNNTAEYGGNDIYSYSGDVDYSTNWWGDNQKPTSDKIFIFLGNLKLTDWIIMSFESVSGSTVQAALNKVTDDAGNIKSLNYNIPIRPVYFSVDNGNITPEINYLSNNTADAVLIYDVVASDFKAYAKIDNQILELDIRNSNTEILIKNVSVKGNTNKFEMDLINVNGHKISNQTLVVEITDETGKKQVFSVESDGSGHATFNIDYPVGKYYVNVNYLGDGYFEKSNASAIIDVLVSNSSITSYNYTYYGKNNLFYAILKGENGDNLINLTISFTIINSNGESRTINANTDYYGRSEIMLSLEVGEYDISAEFSGNSWYSGSSSKSHIVVRPVNSTIIVPDVSFYGAGNEYSITLKDAYGTLIRGENIIVNITQGKLSDTFKLTTGDDGIARLTVNYVPGEYKVKAVYAGDNIYGSAVGEGVIKIEKVLSLVSGFYYSVIPLNGVYTVVLSDMYGKRVANENISLNCYQGKLIKSYSAVTDANGEATFVIDLNEGTYLTTFDYGGNIWYSDATGAATIVVNKDAQLSSIYINSTDLVQYYGENKYFIINFNDPNAYSQYGKTITVTISSQSWSRAYEVSTDIFGLAQLQINLNPGEYNITYKYSNPYYNIFGNGSNKISIYKMPITVLADDMVVKYGEPRTYSIYLRDINNAPIKNMQVHISLNGEEYDVITNGEGIANIVVDLNPGEYNLSYSIDNPNYLEVSGNSKILVVSTNQISTNLNGGDLEAYDNETPEFTVMLTDTLGKGISSANVVLEITTVDGEPVINLSGTADASGKAKFNLNLEYGNYIIKAIYNGNELYLGTTCLNMVNIKSSDNRTKTIIYKGNTNIKSLNDYYIVLSDINGTLLSDKDIVFYVGGEVYHAKTDNSGKAYLNVELPPDVYNVKSAFIGDDEYKPVSASAKVYLSGESTQLFVQQLIKYYRNGTQFHALLVNSENMPLSNKVVSVVIQNVTYNCTTDENGWITLKIDLKPGHYDVECYYYGADPKENSFNKTTIDVLSTIIGQNEVKMYGESPYLTVKFLDGAGNPIKNTQFVIGIDGKNYMASTDNNGIFYFTLNLNSGNHIISVNNPYDGLYESFKLTVLPTIYAETFVKVLGDGQKYSATLLDKNGNPLSNKNVDIIVDGLKYSKKTNQYGEVNLEMEFNPKNYLVTVINPVTGEYVENNVKVLHPISGNKDLTMYYGSGKYFKVRILGIGGKPVGAGKTVKFKVNGVTYNVKTDKNGYASLKINLKYKKYTITTTYNGFKVSNKINVKPVLTAKNISKKKPGKVKFQAKLVNTKGKAVSGKKITFKFKNKKYTAKTNSKGYATINLNLKIGKHVIYSIYGKSKIKNTISIKK